MSQFIGGKSCPSVSPLGPVPALFTDTQVEAVSSMEEVERALLSRSVGQGISTAQHGLPTADTCLLSSHLHSCPRLDLPCLVGKLSHCPDRDEVPASGCVLSALCSSDCDAIAA